MLEGLATQTTGVFAGNIFLAAVNVALFWGQLAPSFLVTWMLGLFSVLMLRYAIMFLFQLKHPLLSTSHWHQLFIASSFFQGIAWAILCLYAADKLDFSGIGVLAITLAGLTAGSVGSTSSSLYSFVFFATPTLLPMALILSLQEPIQIRAVGFLIFVFFALTLQQARNIHGILCQSIGNSIALGKSKQRTEKLATELYQLSTTDALTQIANRRAFDEALDREWRRAMRSDTTLAVLLIDVDFFKHFNDSCGHQAGDKCLQKVAKALLGHAQRACDLAARYGGEEFAIILPDTNTQQSLVIARKVCEDVAGLAITHPSSTVAKVITVSIGVHALVPQHQGDVVQLIKYADDALYVAKTQGRNRVAGAESSI